MKNSKKNELAVCGVEAVLALVKENPQKVKRFYYSEDRIKNFSFIFKYFAQNKIPYNQVKEIVELEKICGSVHHQGVVAMIEQPKIPVLNSDITDEWISKKESALVLDRVGNANNLGAIVRSAAFFGFKNIVIPIDESQSSVTTSSYRVAQGGMEYVNVYCVHSIVNLLSAMKGKMVRIGTDVNAKMSVKKIPEVSKGKGALIVLGNEEHGISDDVRKNCDNLVIIPYSKTNEINTRRIESLNVAQAAAIVLYAACADN